MDPMDALTQLLYENRLRGGYQEPEPSQLYTNPTGRYPTMRQQDILKRPYVEGDDAYSALNRQQPREYVGVPEHVDDLFGY